MGNLAEQLPKEQARVRELLGAYKEIGESGRLAALMIESALKDADLSCARGDVVRMLSSLETLRQFKY